jgi:hypothetical protein
MQIKVLVRLRAEIIETLEWGKSKGDCVNRIEEAETLTVAD